MNILNSEPKAERVLFDENAMTVEFKDGRKLSVPLAYFSRRHLLEGRRPPRTSASSVEPRPDGEAAIPPQFNGIGFNFS
jgi:hypothetical protein